MPYVIHGDKPKYAMPLNAWPRFSYLGGIIPAPRKVETTGRAFPVYAKRKEDDEDLFEIICLVMGSLN